jgi:hypothetical protein
MRIPNLFPKGRFSFSIPVILLIAVFFIGYYFYYIPVNKARVQQNGFLILENIKSSITDRNNDLQNLYKNISNASSNKKTDGIDSLLKKNRVDGKSLSYDRYVAEEKNRDTGFTNNIHSTFIQTIIGRDSFTYLYKSKNDTSAILLNAESVLQPILKSQETELFESYALVDKKAGIIYKDPGLSIVSDIPLDSLLSGENKMFAGIKDIKIENLNYKMFFSPFRLGNNDVILCGFITERNYNAELRELPVSFIYPIVIAFLILVIFLPIIKFYMIGKDETVKFIDLILSALSFMVGPALITLIFIQVLLLEAADLRSKSYLISLSSQIDSAFTGDIINAYNQMDSLDSLISAGGDSIVKPKHGDSTVSRQVINYFRSHKNSSTLDYNFDRIFWIDSLGQQKIKGQVGNEATLFSNVSARKYFRILNNNNAYPLPGHDSLFFGLEPINSWADGEFTIIISKASRLKHGFVVAMATKMPSVTNAILPPGFGFAIIDDTGDVQLHSDMSRNLRENLLKKMTPSRPVKEAIASRQSGYFNDIRFYGKTNAVNIKPISKIPFFLATFYDKGYIVPIAMRIFSFALLFCIFSFLFYLVIWLLIFRKQYYVNPMLYSPMAFLKWTIPKNEGTRFYVLSSRFLTGYILMLLLFLLLSGVLHVSNYVMLVLAFLIPVNVISSLFVINYALSKRKNNEKTKLNNKKAISAIGFQLLLSFLVYLYSGTSAYPIQFQFLIFQAIFNIAMLVFYFSSDKTLDFLSGSRQTYLSQYAALATAVIICLAVLPASIYTWYAHNQEITQSVKKGQLYLAESLQKRSPSVIKFTENRASLELPIDYYQNLQYRYGIYKIYKDSINWNDGYVSQGRLNPSYEQFYFGIANKIGNNYYDPLLMPALKDAASDSAWYWASKNSLLHFKFTLPDNFKPANEKRDTGKSLSIISNFPSRFLFVGFSFRGIILIIIVLALIIGLYRLLHSLAERIFLKKYIETINCKGYPENEIEALQAEFQNKGLVLYPEFDDDVKSLRNEYHYYVPDRSNKEIYKQEKDMIDIKGRLKDFYDFIWQKLSDKEKYLLNDFAQDNLINFKNIEAIYCLLEKGLFIVNDDEIKIFSPSFRAYVFDKKNTSEIYELKKEYQLNSSWQSFRTPVMIVLLGIALFVFFTQQETFQKLTAIVAGMTSVLSLLLKFFVDGGTAGTAKK